MADPCVLLIEDDTTIRNFLRAALRTQQYKLIEATSGREGISLTASHVPDVVILDLGLPDIDGIEVIDALRDWSGIPIVVLSARDQERDKIAALDGGADDYLTKPFGVGELLARIRVALRHRARPKGDAVQTNGVFVSGELEIDFDRRIVSVGGRDGPSHADRIQAPHGHGGVSRQGPNALLPAQVCVGTWKRHGNPVPACVYGQSPAQARARSGAASLHHHRDGGGVPIKR